MSTDLPALVVPDVDHWRSWLDDNEDLSTGVWLRLAKGGATRPTSLTYAQALQEALCSGWIDGQTARVDDTSYRQRWTPRRSRSLWSARNVGFAEALIENGRMRPRGHAEVERARADGRWDAAYAGAASIEPTPELVAALAASPDATAAFATLTGQNRYAVLHRCLTPRTPRGRENAAARLVAMLAAGDLPHPPSPPR